jgi:erythromycin esterase-like protein
MEAVREAARPLTGAAHDYDPLLDLVGDARFVLLGEASHGTHEFYRERARITQRLIGEKGFAAVAVEADRPDAYRVNRHVRGVSADVDAIEALADFRRFPTWMWRNTDVVEFVEWLRAYNDALPSSTKKIGFYGLDLYSLRASMKAVLQHMVETLDALVAHLGRQGGCAKVVVWAHNSHLGDARATQMGQRGELSVGQLMRERYDLDAVLVGFTTHHGTVTAASDWGDGRAQARLRGACRQL